MQNNILYRILTEKASEQDAVVLDNKKLIYELREQVSAADCVTLIDKCYDNNISSKVKCLYITLTRKYCTIDPVRQLMQTLWKHADNILKEAILWRLLDDDTLSVEWHRELLQYVKNNFSTYFKDSIISYYGDGKGGINEVIDSLNDNRFPDSKKWIYLFSLLVYKEIDKEVVKSVIAEEKQKTNNPLTKEVIEMILTEHLT